MSTRSIRLADAGDVRGTVVAGVLVEDPDDGARESDDPRAGIARGLPLDVRSHRAVGSRDRDAVGVVDGIREVGGCRDTQRSSGVELLPAALGAVGGAGAGGRCGEGYAAQHEQGGGDGAK